MPFSITILGIMTLNTVILSFFKLNVIMLSVVAPPKPVKSSGFFSGKPIRDPKTGFCIECGPDEPGEIVGGVRNDDRGGPKNFSVSSMREPLSKGKAQYN
jgi:hypothetical protein